MSVRVEAPKREPQVPEGAPMYVPSSTAEDFIHACAAGPISEFRVLVLMGSRGSGKFQPVTSPVLTPTGWEKLGNIQPGDLVIAGDGTPTEVIGVFHRIAQPVWRLRFSDGSSTLAGGEHSWVVETGWDRKGQGRRSKTGAPRGPKVVTTNDIRIQLARDAWRAGGRWSIPLVGSVQFPPREVPADPYLLGVLIGDGGLSEFDQVRLTTADRDILDAVRDALPPGDEIRRVGKQSRYDYRITGSTLRRSLLGLGLMGSHSYTKFVPEAYLWNAPHVRLAILQGLLDTDGTASVHGNSVSYSTTSFQLADHVGFLVRSLGGLAKIRSRITRYPYKGGVREGRRSYHLSVRLPNGVAPFRLARKLALVKPKGERNRAKRYIVGCEPAGEERVACLEVASQTDLYVTDDFIVTHNTTAVLYAMIALAHRLIQDGLAARLPLRAAVIRDTWENLRRTTVASLRKQSGRGVPITLFDGEKQAYVGPEAAPWLHLYFFGMDNRADVDKLQGFECAILWPEEVAPGAELDVGIPAEVFGMGATSVRQEGVPHRILMSLNPPDEDHWVLQVDQVLMSKGIKNLVFRRFEIPPDERSEHFRVMGERAARMGRLTEARQWREAADEFDQYRQLNEAFLESIGRHDLVARMVHGRIGGVQIGEAVASTFVHELHVTKPGESLILMPGSQIIRAWDGGGQPSTVWIQETGAGNVDILGARTSINLAMAQHILNEVVPFQEKKKLYASSGRPDYRGARMAWDIRDVGDPSLFNPDEIKSSDISAGMTIDEMLNTSLEKGVVEWPWRRDAALIAFERPALGRAHLSIVDERGQAHVRPRLVRIQKEECDLLIKGLNGRWHYPVNLATGRINFDVKASKRASGLFAQPADALFYYFAQRFPAHEWIKRERKKSIPGGPGEPKDWVGA